MKYILSINAGSSSLKYEIFEDAQKSLRSVMKGHIDNHGKPLTHIEKHLQKALKSHVKNIVAVGHRVVHGGEKYFKSTVITPRVIKDIESLCALAPLHNPVNLAAIRAAQSILPDALHVAVFDTSFHQTMPEKAYLYGVPMKWYTDYGVRRYGFHGISHQYVYEQAEKKLGARKTQRTITCHLGNGCSLSAILKGKVIDTSMGFTPLEGIPMGTRSGDIDPAIIFHMARKKMKLDDIELTLTKKSGLTGVFESTGDMREIWKQYQKKNPAAIRTMEWFAYRIAKYIGSYIAALGGLDCIVFTGGTGEHAWYLRKKILKYISALIKPTVLVIPTHEEKKIAEESMKFL
ncbi:acetate/propionate family kinase [Candidatus Gracilibacteria bacterium]|nr:acetate/propionate family kinase [Candidatus Gracilibacteria bacterium]